ACGGRSRGRHGPGPKWSPVRGRVVRPAPSPALSLFIRSSCACDSANTRDAYHVPSMVTSSGAGDAQRRVRRVLGPLARLVWDIRTEGFDRLPTDGPAILCPNHISFLDSAFLMLNVPRNIGFVGKAEYMDSWKTKFTFPALGMIPIDRAGGDKAQAALDTAEAVLRRGE